jgi:hypothetical protein
VYTIEFTCTSVCTDTYVHEMTITTSNDDTGYVEGTGYIPAFPTYQWTVSGTVDGSEVTLDIVWTGPGGMEVYNPLVLTGTVDTSGALSGTAVDNQQREFTWKSTTGAAVEITPTPTETATETATATATPTATPFQSVAAETAVADPTTTLPPTSAAGSSRSEGSTPLFALLVCLAFGALGLAVTTAQRRSRLG